MAALRAGPVHTKEIGNKRFDWQRVEVWKRGGEPQPTEKEGGGDRV